MALKREDSQLTPQILLEGSFLKKGSTNKSLWRERYFVLYDNNLLCYADSKDAAQPRCIDLRQVEYIENDDKNVSIFRNYSKGIAMKTSNGHKEQRIWHFCFKSAQHRDLWKGELWKCTKFNKIKFVETRSEIIEQRQKLERLTQNAQRLRHHLDIKKRKWNLKSYPNCFVSRDAIKVIIDLNIASNVEQAIAFGNELIAHNMIQHVERDHADFKNGYFFYEFLNEDIHFAGNHSSSNSNAAESHMVYHNIMDFESLLGGKHSERDIFTLIRRCNEDSSKLEKLYNKLCVDYPTNHNHIKYEKWLDGVGRADDAMLHFMKRFKFYVLPLRIAELDKYCQWLNYDLVHCIKFHIKYLQTREDECESSKHSKTKKRRNTQGIISPKSASLLLQKMQSKEQKAKLTPRSNSMSITNSSLCIQQQLTCMNVQGVHNIDSIHLFAGLPMPASSNPNDHSNNNAEPPIVVATTANHTAHKDEESGTGYLYRLLTNRRAECKEAECVLSHYYDQMDLMQDYQFTLYEMEEYVGLMLYKCCKEFFCQKFKFNKIPIPWSNKVNAQKLSQHQISSQQCGEIKRFYVSQSSVHEFKQAEDEADDHKDSSEDDKDDEEAVMPQLHHSCVPALDDSLKPAMDASSRLSCTNSPALTVSSSASCSLSSSASASAASTSISAMKESLSRIFLEIDTEEIECIEAFDRIISFQDGEFPKHLNMFNVLILVWLIYRCECNHLTFKHRNKNVHSALHHKQLKVQFIAYLINKLTKQFFMQLSARQHLSKYIEILYYFASPRFEQMNHPKSSSSTASSVSKAEDISSNINLQSHMFERMLRAIKERKVLSWYDKAQIIDWVVHRQWHSQYTSKPESSGSSSSSNSSAIDTITLYFRTELALQNKELSNLYSKLMQEAAYKSIEEEIKIKSGNIIFRQDHQYVLGSKWFNMHRLSFHKPSNLDINIDIAVSHEMENDHSMDKRMLFDLKCAYILRKVAASLITPFTDCVLNVFVKHHNVRVLPLELKSEYTLKSELYSMTTKNIKFPKSASIRDYMSCLVAFASIEDMIKGYERLKAYSARHKNLSIVHIDNCLAVNKLSNNIHSVPFDNLRAVNIHCIFQYQNKSLIGEVIFCLNSILETYATKRFIGNSFFKLLNDKHIIYKTSKSVSVSSNNSEYDWKIEKFNDIQEQYLQIMLTHNNYSALSINMNHSNNDDEENDNVL